jgi:hypothetical protein
VAPPGLKVPDVYIPSRLLPPLHHSIYFLRLTHPAVPRLFTVLHTVRYRPCAQPASPRHSMPPAPTVHAATMPLSPAPRTCLPRRSPAPSPCLRLGSCLLHNSIRARRPTRPAAHLHVRRVTRSPPLAWPVRACTTLPFVIRRWPMVLVFAGPTVVSTSSTAPCRWCESAALVRVCARVWDVCVQCSMCVLCTHVCECIDTFLKP